MAGSFSCKKARVVRAVCEISAARYLGIVDSRRQGCYLMALGTPGPWCRGGVGLRVKPGFGQKRRMLCNREFCRCLGFQLKVVYSLFKQRRVVTLDDCLQRFVQPCW